MKFLNTIQINELEAKLKKYSKKFSNVKFEPNKQNNKLFFTYGDAEYVYIITTLVKDIDNDKFLVLREVFDLIIVFLETMKPNSKIKTVKEFAINELKF